jgi:uncharacterized protein (TIGR02145 family)
MKSKTGWKSPNTGANNETGFTALPAGSRDDSGWFNDVGFNGVWWSSNELGTNYAWYRNMYYDDSSVHRYNYSGKECGFSVRCIKD